MRLLQRFSKRQIDKTSNFPIYTRSASAREALRSLRDFQEVLVAGKALLDKADRVAKALVTKVNGASTNTAPFNDVKLSDALRDTKVKVLEALTNMQVLSEKGSARYAEIISGLREKIATIESSSGALLYAAITEALDEIIEAQPDGASQLEEVRKKAEEGVAAVELNLGRVREVLQGMSQDRFSVWLKTFVAPQSN